MTSIIAPLPENCVLNGYRIVRVLYQGVFSFTYLAVSLKDERKVVIKENIPGAGARRAVGQVALEPPADSVIAGVGGRLWAEQNFGHELKVLQSMNHPGVVKVQDYFFSPETRTGYYVMPCLTGGTLAEVLASPGERKREWVLYLAASLMAALEYVHACGYIHRDVRPENIVFTEEGVPVLIDFGAAREVAAARHTRLVAPGYSPMEQIKGEHEGAWSDVYALGATLYYAISGTPVPGAEQRVAGSAAYAPLAQNKELVQQYGVRFLESVDKALSVERNGRFATLRQWRIALESVAGFQRVTPVVLPVFAAMSAAIAGAFAAAVEQKVADDAGEAADEATQLMDRVEKETKTEVAPVGSDEVVPPPPIPPELPESMKSIKRRRNTRGLVALLVLLVMGLIALLLAFCLDYRKAGFFFGNPEPEEETPPPVVEMPEMLRLIGRVGAKLYDMSGNEVQKTLPPFRVFYSEKMESREIGGLKQNVYVVRTHPRKEPIGILLAAEVHPWPLNLAMRFTDGGERNRSLFFNSEESARTFMAKTVQQRHNLRTKLAATKDISPAEFRSLLAGFGVVGLEPREKGAEFMPVLDFAKKPDGTPAAYAYRGDSAVQARLLNVASMISRVEIKQVKKVIVPPVNVVFVVDTTSSMSEYLASMKKVIEEQVESISRQCAEKKQQVLFGFVGYRDWKSCSKDGAPSVAGADNTDEEFTEKIGYVVNNYTRNGLLPVKDFLALLNSKDESGEDVISCKGEDSIDFREEVFAAVNSAIEDTPWSANNELAKAYRFIYLIGDAACREANEREADCLRLSSSQHWEYRPAGSISGKSAKELVNQMKKKGIGLRSVFVLTMPLQYSTVSPLTPALWLEHSQIPGIRQFAELAQSGNSTNCDVFDTREIQSSHQRMEEDADYRDRLEAAVKASGARLNEQTRRFDELFSTDLKEIINYSRSVEQFNENKEKMEGESAIGRMFANSHVEWMGSENQAHETMGDATGWTQDRDEGHRSAALYPYIVLTAQQLEMLHQRLSVLMKLVEEEKAGILSDGKSAEKQASGQMSLAGSMANTLVQTQHDANGLEGTQPEDAHSDEIKKRIAQLPYRSPMLTAYCAGTVNQDELVTKLKDTLASLSKLLEDRLNNSAWMRDPEGNQKDDFVLISINDLP